MDRGPAPPAPARKDEKICISKADYDGIMEENNELKEVV